MEGNIEKRTRMRWSGEEGERVRWYDAFHKNKLLNIN